MSKSLYGHDPDGIEFEVLWTVPREAWGALEHEAVTERLDLNAELARLGPEVPRPGQWARPTESLLRVRSFTTAGSFPLARSARVTCSSTERRLAR